MNGSINIKFLGRWQPLLRAQTYCDYINDHTVYKDKYGNWRLLGTCAKEAYAFHKERSFVEGVTQSLLKPMQGTGLKFTNIPHRSVKIAPHVYFDIKEKKYHLFFGPMIIYHFISENGVDWEIADDAVRSLCPFLRDPHVIDAGSVYLMFCTNYGNKISVYTSKDLFSWSKEGTALRLGRGIPKSINSSCESPCVFAYKQGFMLLSTIVPSRLNKIENSKNYNNTSVFYSDDPTNFGVYSLNKNNSSCLIGNIKFHASELICEHNKLFLTTCGWKDSPKPDGVIGEGVFIREIIINTNG